MAKRLTQKSIPITQKEHIRQLIEWMSQGVYDKEQIMAVALLCAVSGENMFLLGPPGTAKNMVANRLKSNYTHDGVRYYDSKRKKNIIHTLVLAGLLTRYFRMLQI